MQHPRQLFNPPDSSGSGYHYSPLFVEHTAQRGGEMPRSRSEGMGRGSGCRQHLPLAVLTGPTVPLGRPSFGTQEIHGLAVGEACCPGQASGGKHPACHHLLRAPPHLQPQGPLSSTYSFSLCTCGGRRVHTTLCVHVCGVAEWGAYDPDVTVPTGLPARPRRGASEACVHVGGPLWSWKEQPCSLTCGKCLILSPPRWDAVCICVGVPAPPPSQRTGCQVFSEASPSTRDS